MSRTASALTFSGAVRSELVKIWSVPALRWLGAVALVASALYGSLYGDQSASLPVLSAAVLCSTVFALLAGLSFAGEYSTGAIRTSMTVVPRRSTFFLAKSTAVVMLGFVLGVLSAGAAALLTGRDIATVAVVVLGAGVHTAAVGLAGLCIGGLTRRVAPTAIAVLAVVFLLPNAVSTVRVGSGFLSDFTLSDSGVALLVGTTDWAAPLAAVTIWVGGLAVATAVRLRSTDA
jgi:ABC-2 type transport system permease protein